MHWSFASGWAVFFSRETGIHPGSDAIMAAKFMELIKLLDLSFACECSIYISSLQQNPTGLSDTGCDA